jgi:hypothetical protein
MSSIFDTCKHTYIEDGTCQLCGLDIGGVYIDMDASYSEHHQFSSSSSLQPFEADLKNLSISDEVKNLVYKMAMSCRKETHRMGVRKQQIFSFIYFAYLQLGYNFDPEKIIKELGMTQRETNMALRIISGTSASDIPLPLNEEAGEVLSAPVVVISPILYINEICKENDLEKYTEEISKLAKETLDKNKLLFEFNPKHVALAIVKHYMNLNAIVISKFAKVNGISDSILKQHITRILKIK